MAETIYTKNAPDAIGPYSQAKVVGNLVFTSGQIAIDPATGNVDAVTIEEQTHQVCKCSRSYPIRFASECSW